jgi:hypothetical protein
LTYAVAVAAALWLARRLVGPVGRWAALALALGPLLFTGKAILLGRLYGPADLYYSQEPWRRVAAQQGIDRIANPILSDLAFANLPWRAAVREALTHGRFPFWNRFVLGGTPLLAATQAAIFHPSTWFGILLPVPLSWTFSCAFTLFLALLSGYLFFRDFRISEVAALIGAAGWGFSTYMIFWDGWSVGTSTATLPMLLLGLRRIAGAVPGGVGLTVTGLLLMVAGGHPESWLHCAAAAALFFAWELAARHGREVAGAFGRAASAAGLALLLAAPQLLPLLEAIPHSAEYRARRETIARGAAKQSVPATESARRMLPALLPFAHGIFGQSPVQLERADGSGVPLAYAGAMLFPLAMLSSRRRFRERGRTIFILFLLIGLLAGASAPGLLDLLVRLPGFSLALNYRLVFLAGLGLAGLAAFGAEELLSGERRRAGACAAVSAVVLVAVFLLSRGVFRDRALSDAFVAASFAAQLVPLLVFGAVSILPGVNARACAALALLLLAQERWLEMKGTYPTIAASSLAPPLSGLEAVAGGAPGRLVAAGDTFRPNAAALYGLEDVRGYESIVLARLADTFPLWSARQAASFNRVDDLSRPFLSFLNVRYALASPEAPGPPGPGPAEALAKAGWRLAGQTGVLAVWENPHALPRAFVPKTIRYEPEAARTLSEMAASRDLSQTVWVEDERARSADNGAALLELRAAGPDLIVAADAPAGALVATSLPAWPGWRAETSGRDLSLLVVDHAFVGFSVPAGRSFVRLHYHPPSWRVASAAFLLGLALSASIALRRAQR